jgi:predicted phage-related endonuclease
MRWGDRLEELILQAYAEETGRVVQRTRWTYRSNQYAIMIASPDGFQISKHRDDAGLVQAKNTFIGWDEEVPMGTWIQMQAEMAVTGLAWNTAVALAGGNRLVYKDIERDDEFINNHLIPRLSQFWVYVEAADPLPDSFIDGSEHTKKALFEIYPEDDTLEHVSMDGTDQLLHDELQGLKSVVKNAKQRASEIENFFRAKIGSSTCGVLPDGGVYSLKTQSRKEHVVKASTFRVLRFKESKER